MSASTPDVVSSHRPPAPVVPLLLAFAAVYVLWGSTYLAIRYAIETIPPFMMAGVRFTLAGLGMHIVLRLRGEPAPRLVHWRSAFIIGGLLFLIANGMICWAEQTVPTGLTALLVGTVPLWMALLDWMFCGGPRPTLRTSVGMACGVVGIIILVNPTSLIGQPIHLPGAMAILVSCLSWAIGSLYARHAPLPKSVFLATGMELFAGGVLLLIVSVVRGEWASFSPSTVTLTSALSVLYLMMLGSIIAFTAYVWLLNRVSPAAVSTYAFVNPIVAIGLGWLLAGETFRARAWIAAALILAAVVLITLRRNGARTSTQSAPQRISNTVRRAAIDREPCEV